MYDRHEQTTGMQHLGLWVAITAVLAIAAIAAFAAAIAQTTSTGINPKIGTPCHTKPDRCPSNANSR